MSLAMYASEFNNEDNIIQKKREISRNKTIKKRENVKPNPKLEAMMKRIHDSEDDDQDLSDFQPLHPPNSVGIERLDNQTNELSVNTGTHEDTEHNIHERIEQQYQQSQQLQQPHLRSRQHIQESFTQLPSEYAKQYYQQYVPYYNQSSDDQTPSGVNKDDLLTKLNQIIYLLEEQQEEKTGHVTEELILYSFLGIFIIFIVDSFARAGKYVR